MQIELYNTISIDDTLHFILSNDFDVADITIKN